MKKKLCMYLILILLTLFSCGGEVKASKENKNDDFSTGESFLKKAVSVDGKETTLYEQTIKNSCSNFENKFGIDYSSQNYLLFDDSHLGDEESVTTCIYTFTNESATESGYDSCVILQLSMNSSGVYSAASNSNVTDWNKNGDLQLYDPDNLSIMKNTIGGLDKKYITGLKGFCPVEVSTDGQRFSVDETWVDSMKLHPVKQTEVEIPTLIQTDPTKVEDLTCEELLGETGVGFLKVIKNIIMIFVPIVLIGIGSLDFAKAIFANDENEMKKAQGKFIKRIIIAVGIFLVPIILGVILDIAHGIWPAVDNSLCGIYDKE